MSLRDLAVKGVKIANKLSKPFQATVTLQQQVLSTDGLSTPSWPTSVKLQALVSQQRRERRGNNGDVEVSNATVTFVDPVKLKTATNNEGLKREDRVILPDGSILPVLWTGGFIDAGTGRPFATKAML